MGESTVTYCDGKNGNDSISESTFAPFQPQTEEQLLKRIDHSLAQIDAGLYFDAEDVENELLAGIEDYESKLH